MCPCPGVSVGKTATSFGGASQNHREHSGISDFLPFPLGAEVLYISLIKHFCVPSWMYLRHKLTQGLFLILVQECLRLQKRLVSELGLRLLYISKKTARSLQMKTESRVSGGEKCCYLLRGRGKSAAAPQVGGEFTAVFLSCNTFHLLFLRKFLLCCSRNPDSSVSSFHSRGGDKIQQLHQLPTVPQWEKN